MLKILTWNINGIRARKIPLKQLLDSLDADIICLQETKVSRELLDEVTAIVDGYSSYFSFSKVKSGYSGVATFVRDLATPCRAEEGLSGVLCQSSVTELQHIGKFGHDMEFTDEELTKLDSEGRCVITEHNIISESGLEHSLVIINVYCPRAEPGNADRLSFKLRFYRLLQLRAEAILDHGSHVIVLGDINTSHKKIDHCSPNEDEEFYANPGRQWMDSFLLPVEGSQGDDGDVCLQKLSSTPHRPRFVDTFRWLHPMQENAYTNWCTLTGARATNYGCRLDYIMVDAGLVRSLLACHIMPDVEGSDHCPVKAEFSCSAVAAEKCPPLCTKYLAQFAGRQQKLAAFFSTKSAQRRISDDYKVCDNEYAVTDNSSLQLISSQGSNDSVPNTSHSVDNADCCRSSNTESQNSQDSIDFRVDSLDKTTFTSAVTMPGLSLAPSCKRIASNSAKSDSKKMKSGDVQSKQGNLLKFFSKSQPKVDSHLSSSNCVSIPVHSAETDTSNGLCDNSSINLPSSATSLSDKNPNQQSSEVEAAAAWKNLLKGPPQTPLCKGHQEPCVLRTVKKDGPNKGKQFWTCNRPEGHKNNPEARCDHFVWLSRKKF